MTTTVKSKAGGRRKAGSLDDGEFGRKTSDLVFYVLCREKSRPIHKRSELMAAVDLSGRGREDQEAVMVEVKETLDRVFGFVLRPLDEFGEKYKNCFILINKLTLDAAAANSDDSSLLFMDEKERARLGLLFAILGLIFMSNNVIRDDVLDEFLVRMKLKENDDLEESRQSAIMSPDLKEVFGSDIKVFIQNELGKKQHYIDVAKVEIGNNENPTFEYRWGIRARCEVRRSQVLLFISQLYNCSPQEFKDQYQSVIEAEGEDAFVGGETNEVDDREKEQAKGEPMETC